MRRAEVRSRTKLIPGPGSDVAQAVAKGEADMGVTLISEILPVPGASLGGELPADFMTPTVMYAFQVIEAKGMKPPKE